MNREEIFKSQKGAYRLRRARETTEEREQSLANYSTTSIYIIRMRKRTIVSLGTQYRLQHFHICLCNGP